MLAAVLISEWSNRTLLSSAALFVGAGWLAGPLGFGLVALSADDPLVYQLSEAALFTILFSDGLKLGIRDLRSAWHLPGRALLVGMPVTALLIAMIGRLLFGLSWLDGLLVGVILSPTDPVFASAIIGRKEIPRRVRRLLHVESGLNDGLALPFVLALLALRSNEPWNPFDLALDVAGGATLGVVIAGGVGLLQRLPVFLVAGSHQALLVVATGILAFAGATALGVNEFLAAFSSGVTLASVLPGTKDAFHDIGEHLGEALKLAAVLVMVIMMSGLWETVPVRDYIFAALVLTFGRTAAMLLALAGSRLTRPERFVAAWFGPKGFASIIYGLLLLQSRAPGREALFQLVAVVVVLSILLHSSTDVPIAQYFGRRGQPSPGTRQRLSSRPT